MNSCGLLSDRREWNGILSESKRYGKVNRGKYNWREDKKYSVNLDHNHYSQLFSFLIILAKECGLIFNRFLSVCEDAWKLMGLLVGDVWMHVLPCLAKLLLGWRVLEGGKRSSSNMGMKMDERGERNCFNSYRCYFEATQNNSLYGFSLSIRAICMGIRQV